MNNKTGEKIQNAAHTVVCIQCVLAILSGILMMFSGRFLIGCLVIGFGCFFAWLTGLLLQAFGEITDSLAEIKMMLKHSSTVDREALALELDAHDSDTWVCHSCKTVNAKKDPYCKQCYVSQVWSDAKYREEKK